MGTDELQALIKESFKQGKRRNEIKDDLIYQGYPEEEIDEAIRQIQHDAIKQLPGISSIYSVIENFEKKSNLSTARMTVLTMIFCVAVLFFLAAGLYFVFDPLGTRSGARDAERQADTAKLQTALGYYYQQYQKYPDSLSKLTPEFLSNLPHDPQTGAGYSYKLLDGNTNYELCTSYEMQSTQCVNALDSTSAIPVVATTTPEVPFVPQSATSSAKSGGIQ
jgi:hypothetical protein